MLRQVAFGSHDYDQVVELRDRILRKPLGLAFTPEQLASEHDEVILGDFRDGRAVASLQFIVHGTNWRMRQVAVDEGLQGQGVGSRLVRFSEDWALRSGGESFVLHARDTAVPFYEKLGYRTEGPKFEEVGIAHFKMAKILRRPSGYLPYMEAFPTDLRSQLDTKPLAILPWGALEWHGDHLPAGLDGIVAEEFSKRLASRTGAVLFPTAYLPITTLPHFTSQDVGTSTLRSVLRDMATSLLRSGFKAALLVSGHYAQGHEWELYEAAEEADAMGLKMLAASPLEVLEDDNLLDHAGKWEAACLDLFRPDLLRLGVLKETEIVPAKHAILGKSPLASDPIEGWEVMDRAWTAWARYADLLLKDDSREILDFYVRRRDAYRPYRDRYYKDSWEQAIRDWWRELK